MNDYTKEYQNANKIVLDIETMPNQEAIAMLPEPEVLLGNIKDPEKIKAKVDEAKRKQIEKLALSPLTGIIACVNLYTKDKQESHVIAKPEGEAAIIDAAYEAIKNKCVITYNGKGFDLPFIFKRGIILKRKWATLPELKKYTDRYKSGDNHIDLMEEFCGFNQYEKLDTLARFILGKKKTDFDFTLIPELIKTEEGRAKISEYANNDCALTWELAERFGFIHG